MSRRCSATRPAASLCARCAHARAHGAHAAGVGARRPARLARRRLRTASPTPLEARAHQRLLREFLREHLADDQPLRAFDAWERACR